MRLTNLVAVGADGSVVVVVKRRGADVGFVDVVLLRCGEIFLYHVYGAA